MSVIVYGPQGCGKGRHGPRIAAYFRCNRIVDESDLAMPQDLYHFASTQPRFKMESILYLTSEPAPLALRDSRRVVSIAMALSCVLAHDMRGLESFAHAVRLAADGLNGAYPRTSEINARTVLERLGTPWGIQTMDALTMTERALKFLGWTETARLQSWLQQRIFVRPITTKEAAHG